MNIDLIIQSIQLIGTNKNLIPAFKYIADPLKLEFYISLLLALTYGNEYGIRPNYKPDYIGIPISHAPGNVGDIEVFSKRIYWLIEVTLIRNKTQQLNQETTSVIRHFLKEDQFTKYISKYLSFVAPFVHEDTVEYYNYSVINQRIAEQNIFIKPYSIVEFVNAVKEKLILGDIEKYTHEVIQNFKEKLIL